MSEGGTAVRLTVASGGKMLYTMDADVGPDTTHQPYVLTVRRPCAETVRRPCADRCR